MMYRIIFTVNLFLLIFSATAMAIKPVKSYSLTPESLELNYTQRKVKVDSSITLNTWHLQPVINKKQVTILISYGDYGNMSNVLIQAATLYDLGYDVILYDYRGFGHSSAFYLNNDQLFYTEFVADLAAVYDAYKKRLPRQPIVLMGLSMGTIVNTLFLAQEGMSEQLFIFEGLVTSIDKTVNVLNKANGKQVVTPMKDEEYMPMFELLKLNKGLIFSGREDKICLLPEELREYFEVIDFDGGHLQGFKTLTDGELTGNLYNQAIEAFISKHK
jgi:hypothetical protein